MPDLESCRRCEHGWVWHRSGLLPGDGGRGVPCRMIVETNFDEGYQRKCQCTRRPPDVALGARVSSGVTELLIVTVVLALFIALPTYLAMHIG